MLTNASVNHHYFCTYVYIFHIYLDEETVLSVKIFSSLYPKYFQSSLFIKLFSILHLRQAFDKSLHWPLSMSVRRKHVIYLKGTHRFCKHVTCLRDICSDRKKQVYAQHIIIMHFDWASPKPNTKGVYLCEPESSQI